ncbi:MAG: hypothetical protein EZS28_007056 [Streblomastix strix]|uniref:Uncharacterized protein n=1 Tax=Streblomastix strix TaxID=222440 RepID=A0A5J4WS66_9EUKA|nr:MAG: hypothetical protein EZS28_007056 [Streblomastix strix]
MFYYYFVDVRFGFFRQCFIGVCAVRIVIKPVVAYDAVSEILSPQTINYGSEPQETKKLYRSYYELKSNLVVAFGTGEFGLQQEQVAAVARVAQDNIL